MLIDAGSYFGVSDDMDGRFDGKSTARKKKVHTEQVLTGVIHDRVGIAFDIYLGLSRSIEY